MFYKNKCTGCGKCKEKCPHALEFCDACGLCAIYCPADARSLCGKEYTADEIGVLRLEQEPRPELQTGDVGYIISGDPTYITSYNNARYLIRMLERDELLEELVKFYISNHGPLED